MRVDFLPTLTAEISVWPIVQSVNFSVVPLQHQLLVINVFTIMDAGACGCWWGGACVYICGGACVRMCVYESDWGAAQAGW